LCGLVVILYVWFQVIHPLCAQRRAQLP
jgi:hypothetical protein